MALYMGNWGYFTVFVFSGAPSLYLQHVAEVPLPNPEMPMPVACFRFRSWAMHSTAPFPPREIEGRPGNPPQMMGFGFAMYLQNSNMVSFFGGLYLEPQTTIYKWLFQLDDSQSLHRKWLFHQTSIF